MGHRDTAPVAEVGHHYVDRATPDKIGQAVRRDHIHGRARLLRVPALYRRWRLPAAQTTLELEAQQYRPDQAVLDLLAALNEAGLRGLGGAGFPTGRKWEFVRKEPQPRYLAVNADEGEPGAFKTATISSATASFLEGVLIAAWSIEAEAAYIYLRDEYPGVRHVLLKEIPKVEAAGLAKAGYLRLRRACRRLHLRRRVRDA